MNFRHYNMTLLALLLSTAGYARVVQTSQGERASRLYIALMDANVLSDGAAGTSKVEAVRAECRGRVDATLGDRVYACTVLQKNGIKIEITQMYQAYNLEAALVENGAFTEGAAGSTITQAIDVIAERKIDGSGNEVFTARLTPNSAQP